MRIRTLKPPGSGAEVMLILAGGTFKVDEFRSWQASRKPDRQPSHCLTGKGHDNGGNN